MEQTRIAQVIGKMMLGGVSAVVMNYYRKIDKSKYQFDFIIYEGSPCPQKEEILSLGGRIIYVAKPSNFIKFNKDLKKIFKDNNYKIVHSHISTLNVFPLRIAKKCGIKNRISHSHSTAGKGEFVKNIAKYILRIFSKTYATHYVGCGELAGKWMFGNKAYSKGQIKVFNNAIDSKQFLFNESIRIQLRHELNINDDEYVIGHIGRFMIQKNHQFLINCFYETLKRNSNSKLVLIGEGDLETNIKELVNDLNIKDKVLFLGPKMDSYNYYNIFDAFYLPSLYEGLPVVAIEAQFNGLPCIFSDRMTKEVLINDNVIMKNLIIDEWSNIGTLKRTKTLNDQLEKYDINKEVIQLEKYYDCLLVG